MVTVLEQVQDVLHAVALGQAVDAEAVLDLMDQVNELIREQGNGNAEDADSTDGSEAAVVESDSAEDEPATAEV